MDGNEEVGGYSRHSFQKKRHWITVRPYVLCLLANLHTAPIYQQNDLK